MLDRRDIFEIHRLKDEGHSARSIAKKLSINRETTTKYLEKPEQVITKRTRPSKLEPYYDLINELLLCDPKVEAPVILQKITPAGFDGEITILMDYLRIKRGKVKGRQAFIRFESQAGVQFQIDWGYFGSITYGNTNRRLYALAVVESHSRMMYVEFTHSQKQQILHQCLINAFRFFGGTPKEIVVDNMITAVIERQGHLSVLMKHFWIF